MLDLDGKEWWQVCEQCQIMSCNLCKSIQTLTSYDHVEFWISQHRNSLFFLPTTFMNSLFSWRTTSPLPQWMASSLHQQMASSLPQWTVSPPLLDKWPPPLCNHGNDHYSFHTVSYIGCTGWEYNFSVILPFGLGGSLCILGTAYTLLNKRSLPSLNEQHSMNGLLLPLTNGLFPCLMSSLLPCSMNGLFPCLTNGLLPHLMSLAQQTAPSLTQRMPLWTNSLLPSTKSLFPLDKRSPPSLDEQHPPSLDEQHPPLTNGFLSWQKTSPPSLDEWSLCPPSTNGCPPPSLHWIAPCTSILLFLPRDFDPLALC